MSVSSRKITLNPENTLFYMLNVFHDVIHDYGPGADKRWSRSQQIIKEYYQTQNQQQGVSNGGVSNGGNKNKRRTSNKNTIRRNRI